jgi:hypothetical protein
MPFKEPINFWIHFVYELEIILLSAGLKYQDIIVRRSNKDGPKKSFTPSPTAA